MVWAEGQLIHDGKYEIGKILGRGAFGITYKARHISLNQDVVIKTPDETLKFDPDYPKYVKRFIKEGQLLARLCADPHPHIVRVSDLFEEGDTYCLVMDFLPGESLWDLVLRREALPETEAVEYIRQIGSALNVVHEAGLVHLDVTPSNIMLCLGTPFDHSGKAVLIDFGIAGPMSPPSTFSKSFGNKAFAPYELLRKGSRHPTVDVYCLAASLYYGVTGQRPTNSFDRKYDDIELMPPQQLVPSISDRLNQAILQGMALEASDRPQSMLQWLRLLKPEVITPRSVAPAYRQENICLPAQPDSIPDLGTEDIRPSSQQARTPQTSQPNTRPTRTIPWNWLTTAFLAVAFSLAVRGTGAAAVAWIVLVLLFFVCGLFFVLGVYQILTAGDNEHKIKGGREVIFNACIGFLLGLVLLQSMIALA